MLGAPFRGPPSSIVIDTGWFGRGPIEVQSGSWLVRFGSTVYLKRRDTEDREHFARVINYQQRHDEVDDGWRN